ncbi:hypothetical protein BYT27DRAFT_7153441 [Phlegmacium glaucopus]|nr:hypothetical protein BYT27DRAFT_7153441 [Phlegmacium glaucopus]
MCLSSAVLKAEKKITTSTNFYEVPGVQAWVLDDLTPDAHSSGAPSASSTTSITYQEPCLITKSSCYTHERVHWVNAVRNDPDVKEEVETLLRGRRIVYPNFVLDSGVNLSNIDRVLHAALDKYAFFAVTGSLDTLKQLSSMLEKDNDRRQVVFDTTGFDPARMLDFQDPAIANPQYELVALRAEHMLPDGKVLVAYSRGANGLVSHKTYVPGPDHTLRESPGNLTDPRFPPFSFGYHRHPAANLNPFLVILNAEIKFRRYLRQQRPPPLPLLTDVMTLIHLTLELVKLIYWDPAVRPNTYAAQIFDTYPLPAPEPQPMSPPSDAEMGRTDDEREEEVPILRAHRAAIRRLAAGTTLEERRDYGQYLLSGRDLPFDSDDEHLLEELYQNTPNRTQPCHVQEVQVRRHAVDI